MELLLKQWDPVDQSTSDLVKLIGPPDKDLINPTDGHGWLIYKFAGGMVWWKFETNDGKVLQYGPEIRD